jgi:hypothetical protein
MNKIMKIAAYIVAIATVIFVTTLSATASKSMTSANQNMATPSQSIWFQQGNMVPTHDLSNGVCSITSEPSNNSVWFYGIQSPPKKAFPPAGATCKLVPSKSNDSIWFNG